MIGATWRWYKRNRNTLAVGTGVIGLGYLAGQYALGKLNEARQRISDDRISKENLRRRFQQNQDDCTFTILALLPTATDHILEALPVEQISLELQKQRSEKLGKSLAASDTISSENQSRASSVRGDEDGSSLKSFQSSSLIHASQLSGEAGISDGEVPRSEPKKSKNQLWNEMKIDSIARAFTLIYTLSLLNLFTRIQLNLLGRRNYLSSVLSLAAPREARQIELENHEHEKFGESYGNDFETNRKYLTFSWWILHRGYELIMHEVIAAVKKVFGEVNPREDLSFARLSELVIEVRKLMEGQNDEHRTSRNWLRYLLPSQELEETVLQESGTSSASKPDTSVTPQLRQWLDETADLIDSPAFSHVNTSLLDSAFSVLVDEKIGSHMFNKSPDATSPRVQEIDEAKPETKVKLANILALICRQAHSIGSGGSIKTAAGPGGGNEYFAAMETVADLEAFAALVYSSNFDFEAPSDCNITEARDHAIHIT